MVIGKRITFKEGEAEKEAIAEDINKLGGLCVVLDDGSRCVLSSGEISIRVKSKGDL